MADLISGAVLIGNNDILTTEARLTAYNPNTGEALEPKFHIADETDVSRACDLASAAFDSYRCLQLSQRAEFLSAISEEIMALGDDLIQRAIAETGLTRLRFENERSRTCFQLNLFASVVRRGDWLDLRVDTAMPERQPPGHVDLRLRQIPLGPVAVFGASNFPLAFSVAGGDTASALAAGCPVVVKGHPAHPGTGELVARAIRKAALRTQMPEGVFSFLPGEIATGIALVRNTHIKAVGFTGSRGGGLALVALAAARSEPIPVYAEMSSVNPVFALPTALKTRAAEIAKGYVASFTLGAGQFCTSPGLMFVLDGPDIVPFLEALMVELENHQPSAMLSNAIHGAFEKGREALEVHESVTTVARSQTPAGLNRSHAAVFSTDFASFLEDRRLGQEVFGAASLIIICKNAGELRQAAEHLEGQLTASLQVDVDDVPLAETLMPVLERKVGRIIANGWPTGVEVADAMVHGGPFPATSDSRATSVGTLAIRRFLRPVCYQDVPSALLPLELRPGMLGLFPHLHNGKLD